MKSNISSRENFRILLLQTDGLHGERGEIKWKGIAGSGLIIRCGMRDTSPSVPEWRDVNLLRTTLSTHQSSPSWLLSTSPYYMQYSIALSAVFLKGRSTREKPAVAHAQLPRR